MRYKSRFLFLSALGLFLCCSQGCMNNAETDESLGLPVLYVTTLAELPYVLHETSGIVVSGPDSIWSHGDSGNPNQLSLVNSTGSLLRSITVTNVENNDWEDLARDDQGRVYINDAGNNSHSRNDQAIYRIPNPDSILGDTVSAEIIWFSFEDQVLFPPPSDQMNFNIEAMIWKDDSIFLFTKDGSEPFTGITKMYVLPDSPGTYQAKWRGSYFVDGTSYEARITGADINLQTGELVLLTSNRILSFRNYPKNDFLKGQVTEYRFDRYAGQLEAIGFLDKDNLYLTNEEDETYASLHLINLPPR
jgi:hypothetical protein